MGRGVIVLVLGSLLLFGGCKTSPRDNGVNEKLAAAQIKQAFDTKNRFLILNSPDSLAQIVHSRAVYGHSNCWVQHAEDIINNPPSDSLQYIAINVDELNIDVVDHTGIVHGSGQFIGMYKQDTFDLHLCFVETYTFTDDRWMLVSRQAAKMK